MTGGVRAKLSRTNFFLLNGELHHTLMTTGLIKDQDVQSLKSRVNCWLSQSMDRHLIEVFQEEFGHCSVHDLDQVQQLCAPCAHFHSQEGSANHRKEKCTFIHPGADCVRENKGQVSSTLSSQHYNRPSVSLLNRETFQRKHKIQTQQQLAGLLLVFFFTLLGQKD